MRAAGASWRPARCHSSHGTAGEGSTLKARTKAKAIGFVLAAGAVGGGGGITPVVTHAIRHAPSTAVTSTITPSRAGNAVSSASANVETGRRLAAGYGWSAGSEWACLFALWTRESGWQNTIMNKSSGAFGVAQALGHGGSPAVVSLVRYPGGTSAADVTVNQYPAYAANAGNAGAQIQWGLAYIQATYGTPCGAWSHELSHGWY
jgi:hypothetical protein